MKNKIWVLLLIFAILLPVFSKAVVPKSYQKYVTDEAELLTLESKNYIVKYSDFLYHSKKIDYYVVTVKNLGTTKLEDYADQVYREYGISQDGMLILVSKEDRKIRVQIGTKLSKYISNEMVDAYIKKYFIPYMEREEWNDGIINGYTAFYKYICEKYQIDASSMEVVDHMDFITKNKTWISLAFMWFAVIFGRTIAKFFQKPKKNYDDVTTGQVIGIGVLMVINIVIVSLSYLLDPVYLILALLFEGITVYSTMASQPSTRVVKKRVKQKRVKKEKSTKRKIQKRRKY